MEYLFKPIVFTLLHSIWQGAIVVLLYFVISKLIDSSKAKLKYGIACSLLFVFVVTSAITFYNYTTFASSDNNFDNQFELSLLMEEVNLGSSSVTIWDWFNQHLDVIVLIWLAGVIIMFLRLTGSFFYLNYLIRTSRFVEDSAWINSGRRLAQQLNIRRNVELRLSKLIDVPCVIGVVKPVILFPFSYASNLPIEQVEILLAHELSHIKRYDFLINILQSVIEVLFFFNPFAWALSNIIKTEREHATDDMVVAVLNDKVNYIKTLAAIEQVRFQPVLANSFATNNNLITRIKRLTGMKTQNLKDVKIIVLLVTATMIMSFGWFSTQNSDQNGMVINSDILYEDLEEKNQSEAKMVLPKIEAKKASPPVLLERAVKKSDSLNRQEKKEKNKQKDKAKDKDKIKEKESKGLYAPRASEPQDPPTPEAAPKPHDHEYFYGIDENWSEWSAEFTEKFEQELKELEYLQEMDLAALMEDVNRIVADMNLMNEYEQQELVEAKRQLAEEQRHLAEEHRKMAHEMAENMKIEQLRLKEELKKEMQRVHEEMELQKIEMKRVEEEVRLIEENIKKFNTYLAQEMVKDGYLKNEERIERLDINKNGELKVNDIKIKDKDAERYLKKFEEIMGEKPGDFQFHK